LFFSFLCSRTKSDEIDMKFDNVFVKENFEKDFLSKRDKNDDFDQRKEDLSIF
jgi:glutaredoxin-related protein